MPDSECARFLGRILTNIGVPIGQVYAVDLLPRQKNGGFQRTV
jgi:hypothetical protein